MGSGPDLLVFHQSEPRTAPSAGWQAIHQVFSLMEPETLRTLPSMRLTMRTMCGELDAKLWQFAVRPRDVTGDAPFPHYSLGLVSIL